MFMYNLVCSVGSYVIARESKFGSFSLKRPAVLFNFELIEGIMEAEEEMKKGNFRKAHELFDDLLRKDKSKVHYLLGKADCFVLEGRLMDSLPIYSEAFKSGKVQPNRLLQFVDALTLIIKSKLDKYEANDECDTILQCTICTGILCDPVTLPCGESFCKLCLEKQEAKKCEHCDSSFANMSLKANVILQDILEKSFEKELGATRLRLEGNNLHRKRQSLAAIEKYLEAEKLSKYSSISLYNFKLDFFNL